MLITFALQRLGQDNITSDQINHIQQLLLTVPKEQISKDLKLVPGWIRSIILKAI